MLVSNIYIMRKKKRGAHWHNVQVRKHHTIHLNWPVQQHLVSDSRQQGSRCSGETPPWDSKSAKSKNSHSYSCCTHATLRPTHSATYVCATPPAVSIATPTRHPPAPPRAASPPSWLWETHSPQTVELAVRLHGHRRLLGGKARRPWVRKPRRGFAAASACRTPAGGRRRLTWAPMWMFLVSLKADKQSRV